MRKFTNTLSALLICIFASMMLQAQVGTPQWKSDREKARQTWSAMTEKQMQEYYQTTQKRQPVSLSDDLPKRSVASKQTDVKAGEGLEVPEDMIFPIESDEVQAVLIEWPYYSDGYARQVFDGLGLGFSMTGGYSLVEITSVPDTSSKSGTAKIFGKLADAIQKHAQVWIDVWYDEDTVAVKEFMAKNGTPLTNYRFFVHVGNAFWARDWGPVAFYYGDNDSIAFMDFEYYGDRPMDDQLPIGIAKDLGWKCYTNTIEYEGGNILVDGLGSLFTTSALYSKNEDSRGLYVLDTSGDSPKIFMQEKTPLNEQQIRDSIMHLMNLTDMTVVDALQYDGGTGHIDLYADMWEETGFVMAKYPEELSSWKDAQKIESIHEQFTSKKNYFGKNYEAVRVPIPTKNNGTWYSSPSQYNNFTRCYANHTFVNDAIIQPVFYDTTLSGTKVGDVESNKRAMEVLKRCYPGYTIEEIDVRNFDGYGGAIHCITKQIPADNPIRIYHQPARWFNTSTNGNDYKIEVLSQNHSGIKTVTVSYRTGKQNQFTEMQLQSMGDNLYSGVITLDASVDVDTLLYYISSTSDNGKTITKPMTAKQGGYYVMPFGKNVTTYNNDFAYDTSNTLSIRTVTASDLDNISSIYPNPASNNATIEVNCDTELYFRIINLKGQVMQSGKIQAKTGKYTFATEGLKNGNYWVIITDGNLCATRKLVIMR